MPLDVLLSRLEGVRKAGKGWYARCPAHDDRRASLSVTEAPDGKVLVHCFAACPALDVVQAVGLSLADLFPQRIEARHLSRDQRRTLSMETRAARGLAALGAVLPELAVIEVAAAHLVAHPDDGLPFDFYSRVVQAHGRIQRARLDVQGGIAA